MTIFRRYAVYDPGPQPLARLGARWLGRDVDTGRDMVPLDDPALTDTPRRYGFHATIKAPFRLAPGVTEAALSAELDRLAATLAPVDLPRLSLSDEGGFLSLRPRPQPAALTALAGKVVAALDQFRAPLTEAEIVRRNPDRLTPRQREALLRWGYPYVFEDFHYHMTLTGPLDAGQAAAVRARLAALLDPVLPDPHPVAALALMGEDAEGRFHLIRRVALTGGGAA